MVRTRCTFMSELMLPWCLIDIVCREKIINSNDWNVVNTHAWIYCTLQCIRIFAMQSINVVALGKMLSGQVEAAQFSSLVPSSNILSQPECILVAWLQFHMDRILPQSTKLISSLDHDLADGLALCSVVVSHWPALGSLQSQMILDPIQPADAESNMTLFVSMLSSLDCPFLVTIDEILQPDPCSMLCVVAFLYDWLPQLLPHDMIQFDGKLQAEEVKYLELTNPSSKPIAYVLRLQGHQDFSVNASHLHIEPNCKAMLPVKCTPTAGSRRSANLIMASPKDGIANNTKTLVFRLDSKVKWICVQIQAQSQLQSSNQIHT